MFFIFLSHLSNSLIELNFSTIGKNSSYSKAVKVNSS